MLLSLVTPPVLEPLTIAEAMVQLRLDEQNQEPQPGAAPALALAGLGAGICTVGAHRVACSFVTADGETPPGPLSAAVTVADASINGKLAVSAIPTGGPAVTSVKLWMPAVGTLAPLLYAGSVANGVTTATLNIADASLGVQAPTGNTTTDPDIRACIVDARSRCEDVTGRQLIEATYDGTLDGFPCRRFIEFPRPNLRSVTSVTYVDSSGVEQTWASSNYIVSAPSGDKAPPGRLSLAYGCLWPITRCQADAVRIRFVAGYGTTPASIPGSIMRGIRLSLGSFYNQDKNDVVGTIVQAAPMVSERLWKPFRSSPSVLSR